MAGDVKINIEGLEKLQTSLANATPIIVRHVTDAVEQSVATIEREATTRTPVDTGALRSNREKSLRPLIGRLKYMQNYALFVHEGTRPHFPPLKALAGWAKRHGTSAGVVAKGIAARGTKARPFLKEGAEAAAPMLERFFKIAGDKITSELAQ